MKALSSLAYFDINRLPARTGTEIAAPYQGRPEKDLDKQRLRNYIIIIFYWLLPEMSTVFNLEGN